MATDHFGRPVPSLYPIGDRRNNTGRNAVPKEPLCFCGQTRTAHLRGNFDHWYESVEEAKGVLIAVK